MPRKDKTPLKLGALVRSSGTAGVRAVALPDIQRDFCWTFPQVRSLAASVIARHPIGSILLTEGIQTSGGARVVARSLDRDSQVSRGAPYVLDGQQRLLSLFALFRPPAKEGHESETFRASQERAWLEYHEALRGLWFIDVQQYLKGAESRFSATRSRDAAIEAAADVLLIESCIGREASWPLTKQSSKNLFNAHEDQPIGPASQRKKRSSGNKLPLWLLLRKKQFDSDGLGKWRCKLMEKFERKHAAEVIEAVFDQLFNAQEFLIPRVWLPPISAAQAAVIFRRLNYQGSPLGGSDLVLSQLAARDLELRRDMRKLRDECGSMKRSDSDRRRLALRGLYEADILEVCLAIRHLKAGDEWPQRLERRLALVESEGVSDSIRSALTSLSQDRYAALNAASEVLGDCGVMSRHRWPVANVSIALLACLAHKPVYRDPSTWVLFKPKLIKWWWARSLKCAASGEVNGVDELVSELRLCLERDSWSDVKMPRRFGECEPAIELTARRRGSAAPGQSLTRLIECLLRRRLERDFENIRVDTMWGEFHLHHIFPQLWGKQNQRHVDVLANLALITENTNTKLIGAKGPRQYADQWLARDPASRNESQFASILREHGINPDFYLAEDYDAFLKERAEWLDDALMKIADGRE